METKTPNINSCIFCSIVSGQTAADIVYDGQETLFFYDIAPKAARHIVGITKKHINSLDDLSAGNLDQAASLLRDIAQVAKSQGLTDGGYRVITNVGVDAGQEVKHLHFHILGGERLGPLRCA